MNICIIPSWYSQEAKLISGVFIEEQAQQLINEGIKANILYYGHSFSNIRSKVSVQVRPQSEELIIYGRGLRIPKVNKFFLKLWCKQYLKLFMFLIKLRQSPNIIHAHGYIAGIAAQYISRSTGIPYIITEHSSSLLLNGVRKAHESALISAYNRASILIAVSELLKVEMNKWTNNTVQVISNLVDTNTFFPLRSKNEIKKFIYVIVGGLDRLKRVMASLKAFHSLISEGVPVQLVIVGEGKEKNKLKDYIKTHKLHSKVTLKGSLSLEQVAEEMRKSDALVTVSKTETFGKVIIEALACGIPVLTAESADPEHIIHKGNGIRIPSDLSTLPEAMKRMINFAPTVDPQQLHKEVKVKFGHEAVISQVIKVYQQVLHAHKTTR